MSTQSRQPARDADWVRVSRGDTGGGISTQSRQPARDADWVRVSRETQEAA